MSFTFGRSSIERLATCHPDLQLIATEALTVSRVDFGIAYGHRSINEQQELYAQGRTKPGRIVTYIDGISKQSKHNNFPSKAFDVYAFAEGAARWDDAHLGYIGGVILTVADKLFAEGRVKHRVTWGADWDNDGLLIYDHNLKDMPHFEI